MASSQNNHKSGSRSLSDDTVLARIYNPSYLHVLTPTSLKHMAREWLREDTPGFDYAGFVVGEKEESAVLLMKEAGVIAGRPFVDAVFKELDCNVEWHVEEGEFIEPIKTVATVTGKVRHLLLGERVALNCITRSSGIATMARRLAEIASECGWKGQIAGTRKTTPGFRLVEKYALLVGGVSTHRHDLSSMIMLKDNHIWTAGSITQAVKDARVVGGFSTKIEVECRSLEEAREAAMAGAEIIMLDNFSPESAKKAARDLKAEFPSIIIEISGGITEETLSDFCVENVDVISLGKLTQGYSTIDLSLKIRKAGKDPSNPKVDVTEPDLDLDMSVTSVTEKRRNALSIAEKLEVLEELEKPGMSMSKVADIFAISKSQVGRISKSRDSLRELPEYVAGKRRLRQLKTSK